MAGFLLQLLSAEQCNFADIKLPTHSLRLGNGRAIVHFNKHPRKQGTTCGTLLREMVYCSLNFQPLDILRLNSSLCAQRPRTSPKPPDIPPPLLPLRVSILNESAHDATERCPPWPLLTSQAYCRGGDTRGSSSSGSTIIITILAKNFRAKLSRHLHVKKQDAERATSGDKQ